MSFWNREKSTGASDNSSIASEMPQFPGTRGRLSLLDIARLLRVRLGGSLLRGSHQGFRRELRIRWLVDGFRQFQQFVGGQNFFRVQDQAKFLARARHPV